MKGFNTMIENTQTGIHPYYTEHLQELRLERAELELQLQKIIDLKCTTETFSEGFGADWGLYLDFIDKKYRALGEYTMLIDAEISLLESIICE